MSGAGGDDVLVIAEGGTHNSETYDGGTDADTIKAAASGTFDLTNATLSSIEALTFAGASAVLLASAQIGTGVAANLAVTGDGNSNRVVVSLAAGEALDLSQWTLATWTALDARTLTGDRVQIGGAGGAETATGTNAGDLFDGSLGIDNLFGAGGGDTFLLDAFEDVVSGETYDGGSGFDTLLVGATQNFTGVTLASIEQVAFTSFPTIRPAFTANQVGSGGLSSSLAVDGGGALQTRTFEINFSAPGSLDLSAWTFTNWAAASRVDINGSGGVDAIKGSAQKDDIAGAGGADEIAAGGGADTVDGGADTDTMLLGGRWTDYTITLSGSTLTIADNRAGSPDGIDSVRNVELFRFIANPGAPNFAAAQILNDAPTDIALSASTVAENAANGTVVGSLSRTDADASLGDTATFTLIGNAGGRFALSGGNLIVADGSLLDFEGAASHSVTVRVTDAKGLTFDETVTISLTNVNEVPTVANAIANQTVAENQALNFQFAANVFSDTDGDTLTYSATLDNGNALPAWLTFDATTRTFSGTPPTHFNGAIDITLVAGDGTFSVADIFELTVTPVNDAPLIASNGGGMTAALSRKEGSTAVATVAATDVDTGTSLTYSIIGGADRARFKIDAATGVLTFKAAPDFENPADTNRDNKYLVVVAASDGVLTDTQTVTVTITDVNGVTVNGTSGNDRIDATHGVRGRFPTAEEDVLRGRGGNDRLSGLAGDDTLDGGLGNDLLTGGDGRDIFLFASAIGPATNIDRIADFSVKDDTIHLDNAVFANLIKTGKLAASAFAKGTGPAAADNHLVYYESDTGGLFYDFNGAAAGGDIRFATLAKNLALTSADFFVV